MALVGLVTQNFTTDLIHGLDVEWSSANQIRVKSGACYIPGTANRIVELAADTLVSPNAAAAGWLYVYLDASGTVVVSTVAPAAFYRGTARTQSGNADRRFLRSIYATGPNAVRRFVADASGMCRWIGTRATLDVPPIQASGTGGFEFDLAAWVPPSSQFFYGRFYNSNITNSAVYHFSSVAEGFVVTGTSGDGSVQITTGSGTGSRYGELHVMWVDFGTAPRVNGRATAAGNNPEVSALGYFERR